MEGLLLCVAGSVPIFLLANGLLAQHLFPLVERPKPLVFTNLMGSVLGMSVSFVLIYFFKLGYWGLISSGVVSGIFVFTVFIKFVWSDYNIRPIWDHSKKRVRRMLKIALPLVPHTLGFVLLTSSARIVMSQYGISYDEIGLFSHGSSMSDYAVVITSALVMALSPQIQRFFRSADFKSFRKLYFLCQAVALVTSFLICVWMPEIYGLLIRNARLAQSCDIACLLCFANVVFAFYVFMSTPVFIEKNTMQLLWLVFVPGIMNFVLCYTLIPVFGYRAAIYSTIVSYWSQLMIPFFVGYYKGSVHEWLGTRRLIPLILLVILADLLIANQVMHKDLWVKVIISAVAVVSLWYFYRRQHLYELV
jgi:O-antigen/teichoic acid export membrane protein